MRELGGDRAWTGNEKPRVRLGLLAVILVLASGFLVACGGEATEGPFVEKTASSSTSPAPPPTIQPQNTPSASSLPVEVTLIALTPAVPSLPAPTVPASASYSAASLSPGPKPTVPTNSQPVVPASSVAASSPAASTPKPQFTATAESERASLARLEADLGNVNGSIKRLDDLMTQPRPELASWNAQLKTEIDLWQNLLHTYKARPLPGRLGTLVQPTWLAALARLDRAGELLPNAYQQASGILVSQADSEVAFAELELTRLAAQIKTLKVG